MTTRRLRRPTSTLAVLSLGAALLTTAAPLSYAVPAQAALVQTAAATAVPPTPATLPTAIEPLASYVPQDSCDPAPKSGVSAFRHLLLTTYPDSGDDGISRACALGSVTEHFEGRAFDWMMSVNNPTQVAEVNAVMQWLLAPDAAGNQAAMARRLGLMYIIWNRQIIGMYRLSDGWRPYTGADPHTGHVHFSFTWAGAEGRTSYWTGKVAGPDFGPCRVTGLEWAPSDTGTPNPSACPSVPAPTWPATTASDPAYLPALRAWSGATFQVGSTGPGVVAVQQALGVTADGDFGPMTKAALVTFQTAHGISGTGVVTVPTWQALLKASTSSPPPPAWKVFVPSHTPKPILLPVPKPAPTSAPATSWPSPLLTSVPDAAARALLPYRTTRLALGSRGSAVVALQRAVGVTADGAFGPVTQGAVVRFQQAHRLRATGVVDAGTWAALIAATELAPYRTSVLSVGSQGRAVMALQWALSVQIDGAFGPKTRAALIDFQRYKRLSATGVTSTAVWNALG